MAPKTDVIEQLRTRIAELEAENARLRTVPMKYRRMQFNAQLQDENNELRAQLAKAEQRVAEYNELIYAVQTKHPDETRHQTALRYIRNAENRQSYTAANGVSS